MNKISTLVEAHPEEKSQIDERLMKIIIKNAFEEAVEKNMF